MKHKGLNQGLSSIKKIRKNKKVYNILIKIRDMEVRRDMVDKVMVDKVMVDKVMAVKVTENNNILEVVQKNGMDKTKKIQKMIDLPLKNYMIIKENSLDLEGEEDLFLHQKKEDSLMVIKERMEEQDLIPVNQSLLTWLMDKIKKMRMENKTMMKKSIKMKDIKI